MNEKVYSAEDVRQILRYRAGLWMKVLAENWEDNAIEDSFFDTLGEVAEQYMDNKEAKRLYEEDYYVRVMAEKCKATPSTWIWWKRMEKTKRRKKNEGK